MNFGELTDETASFEIMDKALDAGINFFDTADIYGGPQSPDMEKGYGISGDESVSVGFEEVTASEWAKRGYKPDIQDKWDTIVKKPGYEINNL
jgi:hypothetical protein